MSAPKPRHRIPRATRLEIQAPIRFRPRGSEDEWSWGTTLNLSRSGVLFVPVSADDLKAMEFEFVVHLQGVITGGGERLDVPDLKCMGRVTRAVFGERGVRIAARLEIQSEARQIETSLAEAIA